MILKKILYKKIKLRKYFSNVNKENFEQTLLENFKIQKEVNDFFDNVKVNDENQLLKKTDWNF